MTYKTVDFDNKDTWSEQFDWMMDMAIKMKRHSRNIYKQLNEVKIVNEMMNDKWIGIEEAAEYLGIKPITVRDWIKRTPEFLHINR